MSINFEKYAAKGNEFLNRVAMRLGNPDNKEQAGRMLRCVLRALRNRITTEESLQLMAQLPMAIKSLYVDGWTPTKYHPKIKSMDEFAEEVMKEDGFPAWRDFPTLADAMKAIEAVIKTIADYVSAGELHDLIDVLPQDMQSPFMEWSHTT